MPPSLARPNALLRLDIRTPNVIVHAGINDLKQTHSPSPDQLLHHLGSMCEMIHYLSPRTRIILSPLLPTKSTALNKKVTAYNHLVKTGLCPLDPRLTLINYDTNVFADASGMLKPEMGRFDKKNNCYLESDLLHLGGKGLTTFRAFIKSSVLRPLGNRYRSRSGSSAGRPGATTPFHDPFAGS